MVLSLEQARLWFDGYKQAWEGRDVDALVTLFATEVDYREKRFGPPLLGHKDLRSYWKDRVYEHQQDIQFAYDLWGVRDNECVAFWRASFLWLPINAVMQLDGVARVRFADENTAAGHPLCISFEEWIDHQEVR